MMSAGVVDSFQSVDIHNFSMGSPLGGKANDTPASLFAAADIAMYLNKKESLSSRR